MTEYLGRPLEYDELDQLGLVGERAGAHTTRTAENSNTPPPEPDQVPSTRRQVRLTPASAITPTVVRWLWEERWAVGSFGLLAGREGLGKSSIAYTRAADITRGRLPGDRHGQARAVLICATEDDWAATIVPRLIAAGADLDLVYRVDVVSSDLMVGLTLPVDNAQLEQAAEQTGAAMLLLDPLLSRLAESLDSHRDAEARRALEPIARIAQTSGMFVLGIIHLNKGNGDVLDRVMASKAFTAVARSVSVVMPDPDDESDTRRLFGVPKNNLGRTNLPSIAYAIEGAKIDTPEGPTTVGKVRWLGESTTSMRDALARIAEDPDTRTQTAEAIEWLGDYMEQNGPVVASAEVKAAAKEAGIHTRMLTTARQRLRITSESRPGSFPRVTDWRTPHSRDDSLGESCD